MDKLSKLGVTIERRAKNSPGSSQPQQSPSKPFPNLPPGVTLQKKTDPKVTIPLPKGITLQSNVLKPAQQPAIDEEFNAQDLDEWPEDEDYDEEDETEFAENLGLNQQLPSKQFPNLPPGVTFQKKSETIQKNPLPKGQQFLEEGEINPQDLDKFPWPKDDMEEEEEEEEEEFVDDGKNKPTTPSKSLPILPPGLTLQKKSEALSGVSLPKGITIQPNSSKPVLPPEESPEDDEFVEEEEEEDFADGGYEHNVLESFFNTKEVAGMKPAPAMERSKPPAPKQSVAPTRAPLPSFPGLNFGRKPTPANIPRQHVSPQLPTPRQRPVKNVSALPFDPFPPAFPRTKPSPVRAVPPRTAPPPTLITDFLEQQMSLGSNDAVTPPKKSQKLTPVKMNLSEANQLLGQFPKKPDLRQIRPQRLNPVPSLQLPPGISVQPKKPSLSLPQRVPEKIVHSAPEVPVISKLPPGITLEKKKNPPSFQPPNVQLPPGISLQKKTNIDSLADVVQSEEKAFDIDEGLDQEEEEGEYFEDENEVANESGGTKEDEDGVEESFETEEDYNEEGQDIDENADNNEEDEILEHSKQPADLSGELEENDNDLHENDEEMPKSEDLEEKGEAIDFESLISSSVISGEKLTDNNSFPNEEQDNSRTDMEMDDKDMMQNIVDMVAKGEIEGELQEDKEEGEEDEEKLGKRKSSEEMGGMSSPKKVKEENEDGAEGEEMDEDQDDMDTSKVTGSHLRKNIREVMDESKLDEATLAAQRQEAERLKRIQDQQRIIREVQRQIQQNKQTEKSHAKALSLLQSNSQTSILKTSSGSQPLASSSKSPMNHVLLKMGNGQQTSLSDKMRELLKFPGRPSEQTETKDLLGMVSSSVTIAPIKKEPIDDEKKKKKGDVVTLSSDSDDDCIVLSDEEMESEPDEDPTNSGMHTNDRYNVPDEQGRVLVNTAHPPEEPDIFLAPQIAKIIKPHQIGGIRFLYDNIIESLNLYDTSAGFGCILAHSMGLGKTLQIVSFSDIFLRHTSAKKILCIMPINTIQNWQAEYNLWTPKDSPDPEVRSRNFDIYVVNESLKNVISRGRVILEWHKNGGVLLMGYELFRLLSLKKPIKSKRKRPDEVEEERNRGLVEEIYRALVKPGPDLVICDEGHRIKNSHATTSQALKQISTRRRVVLTGYPLQNNLLEYWCMVDFVRPVYLGSKSEFSNMFERPIQNGQCIDSTPQDKRLMRYRAHVLHSLLEGFVQRRSHAVLQQALPKKEEYVLMLRFTDFQKKLYDTFMNDVVRTVAVPNPLKAFAVCCKIWNHPDVLFNFMKKKEEQIDLDLEEALPPGGMPPRPLMDMHFGPFSAHGPVIPSLHGPVHGPVPWPKRGPGSRGGKVRQSAKRKPGAKTPPMGELPLQQQQQKPKLPENPLPSMSNFTVQSSPAYSNQSTAEMPSPQRNVYQQQGEQQKQQPFQQQQQQNNYNSSSFNPSHTMFTEHDLFPNNDPLFRNNEFPSNFGSESNFFQGQQYQQSNVGNTAQFDSGNMDRQFFNPNDNSVSSGFDYNQSTSDFNQMPGFPSAEFEGNNFDAAGNAGLDFPALPQQQQQQQQQQMPQMDQQYWGNWQSGNSGNYSGGSSSDEFMSPPKFSQGEKDDGFGLRDFGLERTPNKLEADEKKGALVTPPHSANPIFNAPKKSEVEEKKDDVKLETPKKDDVPYDWAVELFKNYVTGVIANSSKMEAFFLILNESIARKDRLLLFSQSLLTLDLIEEFLQKRKVPGTEQLWLRNRSYFRLDGSTPALEREKLINEFNSNTNVHLFLVSTRAGSLGINLVGANRVIVFDASWNPCHDTQAVCRVYRYGQKKPCYVYRFVMDCCLEKKIYDRQINKQGMADRVVDELNPDAHLSLKEATNLCWDDQEETEVEDYSHLKEKYHDDVIKLLVEKHSPSLSRAPFQHESLLVDRKEKKLSQAEKRLAKRSYELEKQQANAPKNIYQLFPNSSGGMRGFQKPIASVKPMQMDRFGAMPARSKWIPAEVWQKQGMSAQEMTLPVDVVIPTNSPDKTNIVLKAGERVMVLKSPKGIYMQLQTGKIIAIRTAFKVGGQTTEKSSDGKASQIASALKNNPNVTITHKSAQGSRLVKTTTLKQSSLDKQAAAVNMAATKGRVALLNKAKSTTVRPNIKLPLRRDEAKATEGSKTETDAKPASETSELLKNLVGDSDNKELDSKEAKAGPSFSVPSSTDSTLPLSVANMQEPAEAADVWNQPAKQELNSVKSDSVPSLNPTAAPAKEEEVKKEEDPTRGYQGGYPMDPYGNYYPGYYPYGPHGYDGYPYHQPYPPHMPHVKQEAGAEVQAPPAPHPYPPYPPRGYPPAKSDTPDAVTPPVPGPPHHYPPYPPRGFPPAHHPPKPMLKQDGGDGSHSTPPPAPMYSPYPAPYPYPYNYAPYPPQAQPPAATAAPAVKAEPTEAPPFTPPYGPRPPYPAAPAPPYYNYPPYRPPFHDPNYPYPNYNPYMPGYGYPMQGPVQHQMQHPQHGGDGSAVTQPSAGEPPN